MEKQSKIVSKCPLCHLFFQKTIVFVKKEKKNTSRLKNKCTYKFCTFKIKNALVNISESSEFRFQNSLKQKYKLTILPICLNKAVFRNYSCHD